MISFDDYAYERGLKKSTKEWKFARETWDEAQRQTNAGNKRLRDALQDAKHYLERIDGLEGQHRSTPKIITDTAIKIGKAYAIIATALAGKE